MPTIRDVAKHVGVSVATVSRVLNDTGYVNDDTRKKVQFAIEELNYKPNAVARSLFKKKSKTIGLIVPDIKNPFFPELARAVEDVVNREGYTVFLGNSDENPDKERNYIEKLKQKYVDGIIVITNTLTKAEIEAFDIPVILIDRPLDVDIPTVFMKNRVGGRMATQYLQEIGCKRIAHIRGPEKLINADDRCKGYLDVVGEESWFDPSLIVDGRFNLQITQEVVKKLLLNYPDIDGIFAGNDLMAIGALKAAEQLGICVPEQLSVIGFDGIDLGELTTPELTTIAQPIYRMGSTAAQLLIQLIEGNRVPQKHFEFDPILVKRNSTK